MTTLDNTTPAYPSVTDDDGTGQTGTVWNDAFDAAVKACLDAQLHSSTNPTRMPKNTTDEVVTARGSLASLDARLDVVLNEDGTLKSQSTLATEAELASQLGADDLVVNGDLSYWPSGGSAAPSFWTLAGAGAAVARTGSGESDTYSFLAGTYSAKLTYGAATVTLSNDILSTSNFSIRTDLRGLTVSAGMWGKTSVASALSIIIDDGITTTRGGETGNGTYHSGGGTAEWLYCTHTLSDTASKITIYAQLAQNTTGYVGGFRFVFSDVALTDWLPNKEQLPGLVHAARTFITPPLVVPGGIVGSSTLTGGLTTVVKTDATARQGTGTAETDATSYTVPAGMLHTNGMALRVKAWGYTATGGSTRTIKLYWDGTALLSYTTVIADGIYHIDAYIMRTGAATQVAYVSSGKLAAGLNTVTSVNTAVLSSVWQTNAAVDADLTAAVILKTTVQDGTAGTNITQLGCIIELIPNVS